MVTIVIPTRNEAAIIRENIARLTAFLRTQCEYTRAHDRAYRCNQDFDAQWRLIVADNGSTDATAAIVRDISAAEPRVELLEIAESGKGRAVLTAWTHEADSRKPAPTATSGPIANPDRSVEADSTAVFVFMDADLATDLAVLPKLIAAIRSGTDIAIGSRYAPGAQTQRSILRHIVSLINRFLLRVIFGLRITDPPCGCKAVNARVVRDIVPLVRDTQWFFDTELLVRAQAVGMRIVEIPVRWHEPRHGGSLRKVLRITSANIRAIVRLRRALKSCGA